MLNLFEGQHRLQHQSCRVPGAGHEAGVIRLVPLGGGAALDRQFRARGTMDPETSTG